MLQDILIERKVYASEEHKMMKGMIQEFISNEIMDHIDEWEKNGMVSRFGNEQVNWLLCIDMPEIYGGGGLDFTFNALLIEEFAKKLAVPFFTAF
jgi:acyl-CoA dehydrogenase